MIKLAELKKSNNIAELLEEDELSKIAQRIVSGYEIDKESRAEWEEVIDKAMDIAKQTLDTKHFPWPNASNVKFPLITKGSIDFASRMLPELIRNDEIVKISVTGEDPEGLKARRATRVQEHMSYQLLKQSDAWEDSMDKVLHVLPVLGTVFKKTYYDPIEKRPMSEMCLPKKIVVNYNTDSLEKARRITHEFTFFANDIVERIRAGLYLDIDIEKLKSGEGYDEEVYDPPLELLEQHCWLDLDEDGYEEPYIVVMHAASQQILRIRNRFKTIKKNGEGEVKHIKPVQYFTDYHFLRSPDGGFYSVGFGTLLYPLNASINTLLNQLIDSGTLHNQQSGFIGRGLRIKSGEFKMKMGEWKVLDSAAGTNIQQNVVPLPTKEPSGVLFQLLGLLIDIGKDLTATNDALEGKQPAQNVPATTMLTLVEQGMKVYNAITKRLFRALRKELNKLFELNREYLTDDEYRRVLNNSLVRVKDDYETSFYDIIPVADPTMASDAQRMGKAQALMGLPGLNPYETTRYYLESLHIERTMIDKLLPKPDPQAPPPPEQMKIMAEIEKFKAQAQALTAEAQDLANKNELEMNKLRMQQQDTAARVEESRARVLKMQQDARHGDDKVKLAASKAEHEAQMKEVEMVVDRERSEADLSIKSMKEIREAYKVKSDEDIKTKEVEKNDKDRPK
jgi:chaperonin GroES